ncbi:hypothetical protein JCM24511_02532 [Saitozyma sp. JCM 24511]|nr:hypothetical protein JCM24511_02532 [Saitozyma sp. JCM 24511]
MAFALRHYANKRSRALGTTDGEDPAMGGSVPRLTEKAGTVSGELETPGEGKKDQAMELTRVTTVLAA